MQKVIRVHDQEFEVEFVIPPPVEEFLKDHQLTDSFFSNEGWELHLHDALQKEKHGHLKDHDKLLVIVNGFFISDSDKIYINPRDVHEEHPLMTWSNRSDIRSGNPPYSIYYIVYKKDR